MILPHGHIVRSEKDLPRAIWMPTFVSAQSGYLPYCYRGSPFEMVQQMAREMGPSTTVHDAIDFSIRLLADSRSIRLHIPRDTPEEVRSVFFVIALLAIGIATSMPSA
jgi:hypothetical protein